MKEVERTATSNLQTRVVILEAALSCISLECERALDEPTITFGTICRVASVTRQVLTEVQA